ncbi:hypothetical protein [Piscinibacter sakaiensis]|uniref:hypothetical protein n=1 Tax=Piscinibacter sakaiensis TaxID=1547922 RepID=UPI00372CFCF9
MREAWGWAAEEGGEARASKAKPSREIKVDAVRAAVAFAQSTASRGRSKVVLVHPAEDMNGIAANALLKTLEEPPGAARFILCSAAPAALLPTIRSRCQAVPLAPPPPDRSRATAPGCASCSAWRAMPATPSAPPSRWRPWWRGPVKR